MIQSAAWELLSILSEICIKMCYTVKQTSDAVKLVNRFKAEFTNQAQLLQADMISGFTYPLLPVITNQETSKIQLFHWGLIPTWSKDKDFRKNTLNAKMETIAEKPSFRASVEKRCLILVDGFYEYQWLDPKGKTKQRYLMTLPDKEPFALAGIWNTWTDRENGEVLDTFSILTTQANAQMSEIHNTKKRMPIILTKDNEMDWLNMKVDISTFDFPLNTEKV